jgi:hypothetical protein
VSDPINDMIVRAAAQVVAKGRPATSLRIYEELDRLVSEKVIRKLRRSLISRGLLDPGTRRRHYVGRRVVGPAMPDTEERIAFHTARVERELGGLVAAGKEKPVIRWNNGARKK